MLLINVEEKGGKEESELSLYVPCVLWLRGSGKQLFT